MANENEIAFVIKAINDATKVLRDVEGSIKDVAETAKKGVDLTGDADQKLKKIGDEAEKSNGKLKGLIGGLGQVAKIAAGFVIAQGLVKLPGIISGLSDAYSDLSESQSKNQVIFEEQAASIIKWSEGTAGAIGVSQAKALEATGIYGNLFRALGVGSEESADLSTNLVELAADLASFNNLAPEIVLEKLRSGLLGSVEPLQTLGVNFKSVDVAARAVELGLAANTKEVSEAAKMQARYSLIMQQTTLAQGDFARTSDGLANKQRIQAALWADVRSELGEQLIPVMLGLSSVLVKVIPDLTALGGRVIPLIGKSINTVTKGFDAANQVLSPLIKYFQAVVRDGDYLNDWLTHLPEPLRPIVQLFGEWAAVLIEDVIPAVVQFKEDALDALIYTWENDLVPILETTQEIFEQHIVPVLESASKAVEDLAIKYWPVLVEGFEKFAKFIQDNKEFMAGFFITLAVLIGGPLVLALGAYTVSLLAAIAATVIAAAPFVAIVIAMSAVVGGIIWLVRHWDELRERYPKLAQVSDELQSKFKGFSDWIMTKFVPAVKEIYETVADVVGSVVKFVGDNFPKIWNDWIEPVLSIIVAEFTLAFDFLWKHAENVFKILEGVWMIFKGYFTGDWGLMWDGIKQVFSGIWDDMVLIVSTSMLAIKHFFESGGWTIIKNSVVAAWNVLKDAIGAVVSSIVDDVKRAFTNAINSFIDIANAAIGAFNAIPVVGDLPKIPRIGESATVVPSYANEVGIPASVPSTTLAGQQLGSGGEIPTFATGGIAWRPQLAYVAERGPEEIRPLGQSGGNTYSFTANITLNGHATQEDAKMLEEVLDKWWEDKKDDEFGSSAVQWGNP